MVEKGATVDITLRIPADWSNPRELLARIPSGFRLTPDAMISPDGQEIQIRFVPPDDQFPQIFQSSCRNPPSAEEIQIVNRYAVNVILTGPGGSMESARTMIQAGAAIVAAGGAGVFIDNSGVAHGGGSWSEMAADGGPDAMSFALIGIVRGKYDIWTMGMHMPGMPDIVMKQSDLDADGGEIIDLIRYLFDSDKPFGDGHIVANEGGARFSAERMQADDFGSESPMHNPFGRLRLVSIKDIAERN